MHKNACLWKRECLEARGITGEKSWRPQPDLNRRCRRERPVSWTWLDDGDATFGLYSNLRRFLSSAKSSTALSRKGISGAPNGRGGQRTRIKKLGRALFQKHEASGFISCCGRHTHVPGKKPGKAPSWGRLSGASLRRTPPARSEARSCGLGWWAVQDSNLRLSA